MITNIGVVDRTVRAVIGLALLWYAIFAAPSGYNWIGWIGVIPLANTVIGWCLFYWILGVSTCPAKKA